MGPTLESYSDIAALFRPSDEIVTADFILLSGMARSDAGHAGTFKTQTALDVLAHIGVTPRGDIAEILRNSANWSRTTAPNDRQHLSIPLEHPCRFSENEAPGSFPRYSGVWSKLNRSVLTKTGNETPLGCIFICAQPWIGPAKVTFDEHPLVLIFRPLAHEEAVLKIQVGVIRAAVSRALETIGSDAVTYLVPCPINFFAQPANEWHSSLGLHVYIDKETANLQATIDSLRGGLGMRQHYSLFQVELGGMEYDIAISAGDFTSKPWFRTLKDDKLPRAILIAPFVSGAPLPTLLNGAMRALTVDTEHVMGVQVQRGQQTLLKLGRTPLRRDTPLHDQVVIMLDQSEASFTLPPFDPTSIMDWRIRPQADIHCQLLSYGSKLPARPTSEHSQEGPHLVSTQPKPSRSSQARSYSMVAGGGRPTAGHEGATTTMVSYENVVQRIVTIEGQVAQTHHALEAAVQAVTTVASTMARMVAKFEAVTNPVQGLQAMPDVANPRIQGFARLCACGCELIVDGNEQCSRCRSQVAERCRNQGLCPKCIYTDRREDGFVINPRTHAEVEWRARRQENIAIGLERPLQLALRHRPDQRDALLLADGRSLEVYLEATEAF